MILSKHDTMRTSVPRISPAKLCFFTTSPLSAGGQKWRIRNGLASDGLAYGPLTDLPDWSYVDGASNAPESKRRRKRQNKRMRESQRIVEYLKDFNTDEESAKDPSFEKIKHQ
ncbi:39S ribosomal protein L52, mitochondrial-like isoform X2 [Xenia sp. Carnegie-2017]|uniref:39S ribosomal protein L52, mitochondrial-like isoform X2 n=1 Tax=Xenia sp. Carnegie-2017 TaxID=2897299 RepID=UPI001F03731A|nr:39S ribosomal protein L52, mitochondrial-like isoform X2 [Xenia sp. Carnegie-2017]